MISEGGVFSDAAVLGADVDEEEVAGTEAVSPLVGAPVPCDPVADVHGLLLGAYSASRYRVVQLNLSPEICRLRDLFPF